MSSQSKLFSGKKKGMSKDFLENFCNAGSYKYAVDQQYNAIKSLQYSYMETFK